MRNSIRDNIVYSQSQKQEVSNQNRRKPTKRETANGEEAEHGWKDERERERENRADESASTDVKAVDSTRLAWPLPLPHIHHPSLSSPSLPRLRLCLGGLVRLCDVNVG